ncbi:MAG: Gfo/Idh/MocA family oxidoreductase [Planctomycetota bacterium]|nr:Gfo/Idh/MocA family oxidoreductase [Planctomycetota bacterium]
MDKQYRVGIIGRTGKGNYGHGIDTVWADVPATTVVAVADENDNGRAEAAKRTGAANAYADYREMLEKEKLDIVGVGPRWLDMHHELVLACAEHGCHMYMEKPFCRTLTEADEMVRALEMRHLKLAIAHQTRWTPLLPVVKELISAGEIGQLIEIRGRGKEDGRGGGEDLWVLGSHVLDLMRAFGGDPLECSATVWNNGHPATSEDVAEGNEGIGLLTGDAINGRYQLPNGVTGYIASTRGMAGSPSRFGLQIFGSKGIIEFFTGYLTPAFILRDSSWSPGRSGKGWERISSQGIGKPETESGAGLGGGNIAAVHDLIDCIENDGTPKCSMYDARATVEMIAAVFESHRQQKPVAFPLENRENPLASLA